MLHILRDASTTLHRSNAVSSSHSHETIPVFPQHGLISDECTWRRIVVSDGKPAPRRHPVINYKFNSIQYLTKEDTTVEFCTKIVCMYLVVLDLRRFPQMIYICLILVCSFTDAFI